MNLWWVKLSRYALPQMRRLIVIAVLMLVAIGANLLAPWPMKLIVDNVLRETPLPDSLAWLESLPFATGRRGLLAWLAVATIAMFTIRRLVNILKNYIQAGAGSRMVYALATDLFDCLQRRSLSFHGRHRTGDLIRRVTNETSCVRELVMHVFMPLVNAVLTVVSMFVVMWLLSPWMAVFAICLVFPLAILVRAFARPLTERKYHEWEIQGEIHSLAEQTLTAIPVVQAFGREPMEDDRFRHVTGRSVQANLRTKLAQQYFRVSTGSVTALGSAFVLLMGGISVIEGQMTVGTLLVLVSYFAALYAPIETIAYLSEGFASASAGAKRVLAILSEEDVGVSTCSTAPAFVPARKARGVAIEFKHVSFGYESGKPVLHDICWRVEPGRTVALVGATGGGKSTLVSLIPRLFDPWQGTICFDATDIREFQLKSVRTAVAIVLQQPYLLPLSIADNIAYARPDASRDEVIAAARAAKADCFIDRLPQGYDTVLGERGVTLSGGERQRISIARAVLKDAPIFILDEPTSALDPETEAAITETMNQLAEGRTTIIIAHRLSTIRQADRIVLIDQGRIVEQGSHEELLISGGKYCQLFQTHLRQDTDSTSVALH